VTGKGEANGSRRAVYDPLHLHLNPGEVEPVRVAVIGLGYWGPNLARNLQECAEAELTALCDLSGERLARLGRSYPATAQYQSLDSLLADTEIEAVAISTPVGTHHRIASAALSAGKHVFVEKPLAASSEEALDLIALAQEKECVLMPGHTFLYSPPVRTIRTLIDSGEIGEIYFISTSRVNLGLHQPDVSVAWDLGPHDFSILRYWLGETPSFASALSRGFILPGTPDVAFINLEFPSPIAHVELSWLLEQAAANGDRRLAKMIVYDDTSPEPVRGSLGVVPNDPSTFGEYQLTYAPDYRFCVLTRSSHWLEMQDFCHSIRTGETPVSSAELGLEVVRMIEAVDHSLRQEGARVPLARSDIFLTGKNTAALDRAGQDGV
jgi:predicted dehydrogenase